MGISYFSSRSAKAGIVITPIATTLKICSSSAKIHKSRETPVVSVYCSLNQNSLVNNILRQATGESHDAVNQLRFTAVQNPGVQLIVDWSLSHSPADIMQYRAPISRSAVHLLQ